jgi:hypothetical protein
MTQVYTAPFLLVRPQPRSRESIRLDARLYRCQQAFTFVACCLVVLLACEVQTAITLGIPFIPLP